jgi:hypothetical protein
MASCMLIISRPRYSFNGNRYMNWKEKLAIKRADNALAAGKPQ